jgi:hypothetical protein
LYPQAHNTTSEIIRPCRAPEPVAIKVAGRGSNPGSGIAPGTLRSPPAPLPSASPESEPQDSAVVPFALRARLKPLPAVSQVGQLQSRDGPLLLA